MAVSPQCDSHAVAVGSAVTTLGSHGSLEEDLNLNDGVAVFAGRVFKSVSEQHLSGIT